MKKKILVGVLILIILVIVAILYTTSSHTSSNTQTLTPITVTTKTNTNTPGNTSNTFHSIFSQSGSHVCTYEQGAPIRSSSVIYIADGKMRGEFRTVTTEGSAANFMIYSGGYLYSWKEGTTVGTKSSIKSISDLPQVIPTDLTSGVVLGNADKNISWDCHDWIKNSALLILPAYVKFTPTS
jgi:hypothetical protein